MSGPRALDRGALVRACARPVHAFDVCDSTNRIAAELAAAGAPSGALVVADAQTAGRGRLARTWASPAGLNLYLSLVLRPSLAAARAPLICLAAAAGISDTLGELAIKWPNDLLAPDGRKVGGILASVSLTGMRVDAAVVGVGLNVNQRSFPPALSGASSLALIGGERDRVSLVVALADAIEARVFSLEAGADGVLTACRERSATLGRDVRVGDIAGRAASIRDDGALVIATADGEVPVLTGDVEMVSSMG